jgi:hypothetical protein
MNLFLFYILPQTTPISGGVRGTLQNFPGIFSFPNISIFILWIWRIIERLKVHHHLKVQY